MSGNNPPPGSQNPQGNPPQGGQGGPGQGGYGQQGNPGQGGYGQQGNPGQSGPGQQGNPGQSGPGQQGNPGQSGPGQQGNPGQGGFGQQQGNPGFSQPGGPQQGGQYGQPGRPQQGGPQGQPGGYGQQPGGQPGQFGQPGQGNPYGQGGPGQPPRGPGGPNGGNPESKSSGGNKKLFIILGSVLAGVLVLALIIGVVVLGGNDSEVTGEPAGTTESSAGGTSEAPAAAATSASAAVKGYLEALAANNAAGALGYAEEQPAETSLLTAEVLKASTDIAPITEINVPEVTGEYISQVAATYKMGSTKVSEKFSVRKQDDDTYKVSGAVVDVDVSRIKVTDVPLSINGVEISDDETDLSLFPGTYELTSGLKNLDYGDSELLIKSPSDYASTAELRLDITSDGKKAFIAASKKALDACVKQKKLAPKGCPNTIGPPKGAKYKKGSMKWKVSGNPFGGMDPRLDYDDPSLATASASLKFRYEATITKDGRSGKSKGNVYEYTKFVVDLTQDDPKATFE